MEKQHVEVSKIRDVRKPIMAIKIFYEPEAAAEKEIVKEFFRYVGCLVMDTPMTVAQMLNNYEKHEKFSSSGKAQTAYLFLNDNIQKESNNFSISENESLNRGEEPSNGETHLRENVLHSKKAECLDANDTSSTKNKFWVTFNIKQKKLIVNGKEKTAVGLEGTSREENPNNELEEHKQEKNQNTKKAGFEQKAIECLINYIWKSDEKSDENIKLDMERNRQSLKSVNERFWKNELFPYLQIKRTFRVVNMGEVLALGTRHYDIPDDKFIEDMANAFAKMANECKESDVSVSVYSIYAYVNSYRRIREICNSLGPNSENRLKISKMMKSVPKLLNELNGIYQISQNYVAMYYMAAYLCQSDPRYMLDAYEYFIDAGQYVNDETDEFSAFGVYQLGRYEKQVLNKPEIAFEYYKKAANLNKRCYQAVFQEACYYVSKNKYDLAEKEFGHMIAIISENLELEDVPYKNAEILEQSDWAKLSLKETQYIFKAYIWLAKLALMKYGESAIGIYIRRALSAAIAYLNSPMLKKCCDTKSYEAIEAYHEKGVSVRALFFVLRDMVGDSPANEDLREVIDKIIYNLSN